VIDRFAAQTQQDAQSDENNISKTVKATDFKFGTPVSQGQSRHDPLNIFRKGGVAGSRKGS